ncbi:hypothetical protein P355_5213 [Burkholderia cenocepacia KC-01]|nr:hypothetical protein P355_5213 [Burkholderia cenocepacia KC-01]
MTGAAGLPPRLPPGPRRRAAGRATPFPSPGSRPATRAAA